MKRFIVPAIVPPLLIVAGVSLASAFSGCGSGGEDDTSSSSTEINSFDCSEFVSNSVEDPTIDEVPILSEDDFEELKTKIVATGKSVLVAGKADYPSVVVTADCGSTVVIDLNDADVSTNTNIGSVE